MRSLYFLAAGDGQGVTLAVVSRLSLQPGQWMALGLSSESGGMRGLDVAMLWAAEVRFGPLWRLF